MGSERVHTSLEGSFRLVGWRGRRDDTRKRHCLVSRRGKKTRIALSLATAFRRSMKILLAGQERKKKKKISLKYFHTWRLPGLTAGFSWCPLRSCQRPITWIMATSTSVILSLILSLFQKPCSLFIFFIGQVKASDENVEDLESWRHKWKLNDEL